MASYFKRKGRTIKQPYYSFGETDTFKNAGHRAHRINKKVCFFSNDVTAVIEGEENEYIAIEYGTNKKKWRIEDE
jgi:hypothetical protein